MLLDILVDILKDILKPGALLLSILSLYAVFHATFLMPAESLDERIHQGLLLLVLAGCIATLSGLIFQETTPDSPRLTDTLPMQLFLWTAAAMLVLFAVSWYLETYCVFYRDTRASDACSRQITSVSDPRKRHAKPTPHEVPASRGQGSPSGRTALSLKRQYA